MLNQKDLQEDMVYDYDKNEGKISHFSNTAAWKEIEDHFKSMPHSAGKKILNIIIFADDYESERQRKRCVTGIYIAFANNKSVRNMILDVSS